MLTRPAGKEKASEGMKREWRVMSGEKKRIALDATALSSAA
jgi:hypothetical protein